MIETKALSIGVVGGGPGGDPRWDGATMALMNRVADLREGVESPLAVNVVFQIPGTFATPEFEGLRTARFSRKTRHLMIQVALPPDAPDAVDSEVLRLLRAAVLLAEEFAQLEAMVDGELSELRQLLDRIERSGPIVSSPWTPGSR